MYTVSLTREGAWWHVYVPEIGYASQGRTAVEIRQMARDLISTVERERGVHLAPGEIDLHVIDKDDLYRRCAQHERWMADSPAARASAEYVADMAADEIQRRQ